MLIDIETVEKMASQQALGITALAVKAGLNPSTLFYLRKHKRNASNKTIRKLATALGVQPGDIIKQ